MNILKATYGGVDCTEIVKLRARNGSLFLRCDNSIIGDPLPGTVKYLKINIDGIEHNIKEGEVFVYPKSKNKKLGIFYSNNDNSKKFSAIRESLKTIQKAAFNKADILTCMFNHEPSNPFIEVIAWTKTSSHLNQLLQVMQLLYLAQEMNEYETVSFLEHDVLYPEGYFDYPPILPGTVITNMNYIGLVKNGWQSVKQKDEPFHQMTMRFDEAMKHCESILKNALLVNSGCIEPQIPNIKRDKWECINPAVHVNTGHHFTSHFSIYSLENLQEQNSYWGSCKNYNHLFT